MVDFGLDGVLPGFHSSSWSRTSSHIANEENNANYAAVALATSWSSSPSSGLGSHPACCGYCSILHLLFPFFPPLTPSAIVPLSTSFLSSTATAVIDADLYNTLLMRAAIMFVLTHRSQGWNPPGEHLGTRMTLHVLMAEHYKGQHGGFDWDRGLKKPSCVHF